MRHPGRLSLALSLHKPHQCLPQLPESRQIESRCEQPGFFQGVECGIISAHFYREGNVMRTLQCHGIQKTVGSLATGGIWSASSRAPSCVKWNLMVPPRRHRSRVRRLDPNYGLPPAARARLAAPHAHHPGRQSPAFSREFLARPAQSNAIAKTWYRGQFDLA
jgi:hypothetical protein